MAWNETLLMDSIFSSISYIKTPISLHFSVYLTSGNHSKAFDMVSMVAQKAMTQFYVWQIRYEIIRGVWCVRACAHMERKY